MAIGKRLMLQLSSVTLLTVHDKDPNLGVKLLKICQRGTRFGQVKLFSAVKPNEKLGNVEFVEIPPFGTYNPRDQEVGQNKYSEFMVNKLHAFISTPFILTVQADGFIIRPNLWTSEFFQYDYIGAAWPLNHISPWLNPPHIKDHPNRVGNGGFSLRSKKILKVAAACPAPVTGPEDAYYCANNYKYFISQGIQYAPPSLADTFSKDDNGKVHGDCFGFHGNHTHINRYL